MKILLLFMLLLLPTCFWGQQLNGLYFPDTALVLHDEQEAADFAKSYVADINDNDFALQLFFFQKTKVSRHYTFTILYKQIPLLNSCIKINTDLNGHIVSIKKETTDLNSLKGFQPETELKAWADVPVEEYADRYWTDSRIINSTNYKIYPIDGKPNIVLEMNAWNAANDNTIILDIKGNLLLSYDHIRHFKHDSTIHVKVFNPDPLTSAQQVYGGAYIDNNDSNAAWMNGVYLYDTMTATFDNVNNTFLLENQFARIQEIENPVVPVATSSTSSFLFDRSQSGFEDVNALYHLTAFHNHLAALGFDTLMKLQLQVDTHGQFGADNSAFNRNGGNPTLIFGTGGVDDAEDADVIIHEYSHGVSWSANHNLNFSNERSGLDEGLADYFATSYSRRQSSFNWANMFSWDGHNEFWPGRQADTPNNYPSFGDLYAIGDIWNCAMNIIWTDLGYDVTDQLMLESLHFFTDSTSLPEAAGYVMQSDSLLFAGTHTRTICQAFKKKHILDACPTDITQTILCNSIGFAQNQGDAKLVFPKNQTGSYTLLDIMGNVIRTELFFDVNEISLAPFDLAQGMYIFKIQTTEEKYVYKLIHF